MARPHSSFSPDGDRFLLNSDAKSYKHQFAHLYFMRLNSLRGEVTQRAADKWAHAEG